MIRMDATKQCLVILLMFLVTLSTSKAQSVDQHSVYCTKNTVADKIQNASNLAHKDEIEKLLFGEYNAPFEFVLSPAFDGMQGVRLCQDPGNGKWYLETKRVLNWQEVNELVSSSVTPAQVTTLTLEQWNKQKAQADSLKLQQKRKQLSSYKISSRLTPIQDDFAHTLYDIMLSFISKTAEKKPDVVIKDGVITTFRCVQGSDVIILKCQMPQVSINYMSNLFTQLMVDIENGIFDEAKYLKALQK